MASKRMIPIVTFEDPSFGSLEPEEMVLFLGMIVIGDDEGRLRADPAYLKSRIFGYKKFRIDQVKAWRDKVAKQIKGVMLYEVDAEEYIQLTKWEKYQLLRKDRVVKSIYPDPHTGLSNKTSFMSASMPTSTPASMSALNAAEDRLGKVKRKQDRAGECEGEGKDLPRKLRGRELEKLRERVKGFKHG